jgi:hypothetical protein
MNHCSEPRHTVHDAGKKLHLSPAAVRVACDRGEIVCLRASNGTRLITETELERVRCERERRMSEAPRRNAEPVHRAPQGTVGGKADFVGGSANEARVRHLERPFGRSGCRPRRMSNTAVADAAKRGSGLLDGGG